MTLPEHGYGTGRQSAPGPDDPVPEAEVSYARYRAEDR